MGKGYQDPEFGWIDADVQEVAAGLWKNGGQQFTHATIRNEGAGWRLMLRAAAITTRKRSEREHHIKSVPAYLRKVYERLVLAELEKENGHRRFEAELCADPNYFQDIVCDDIERRILVQQLTRLMDGWTRMVFELLNLGHSYEEIAEGLGMKANAVRSRYHKGLMKVKNQLEDERGPNWPGES